MNTKVWVLGAGVGMLGLSLVIPMAAFADSVSVNFEAPTYTLGNINGQDGWIKTGAYDHAVASSLGTTGFGAQSLRISDSVTNGSFGDMTFAKPLVDSVGETAATAGSFSAGTKQRHFEMQFSLASAVPGAVQTGLHLSVSPDRGDGSRMSYLRFEDQNDGVHVFFDDVTDAGPVGTTANFNEYDIATLDRSVPHVIKLSMDVVDGPSNDIVNVWIDGVLKHTGTSWEDYYRFDPESASEQSPRIVKTLIFRSSGTANSGNDGKGFLIDNLSLLSGPSTVKVTIDKFVDGAMATAANASSASFPMSATWSALNIGSGTGSYALSTTGFNSPTSYEAVTSDMSVHASYSTNEVTGGSVVGADCSGGQPFRLAGYSTGSTLAAAQAATPTLTIPNFADLTGNAFVIVWNRYCVPAPTPVSPANGTSLTSAQLTKIDWTDVTDPVGGITYIYQSSNSSATNPDGSFVNPAYTSGPLTVSEIPTPGTPAGTYYWHVKAIDADGNASAWSTMWHLTVANPPYPPVQCTLSATPTSITRGQAVTLSWTSMNATKIRLTIDRGSIDVGPSGSVVVHPTGTRPYFLSVTEKVPHVGADFKQCEADVTVH